MACHAKKILIREAVPCRLDEGTTVFPGRATPEPLEGQETRFARPFVVRFHTLTPRLLGKAVLSWRM